ncbi:MAG: S53 family serine peptidase [Solirubrobacteraceae bacterium]
MRFISTRFRYAGARATASAAAVAGCAMTILALGASVATAPAAAASTGRVTWLGDAPVAGTVSLSLPLHADLAGLQRFATAVSTPGSPLYGRYEPVSALAQRFGAPAAERSRVLAYLRRAGAARVGIDVTGLFANATLRVGAAQRMFGTRLGDFHSAMAGRFMAPAAAVRIPGALSGAVTGVIGLDTRSLFGAPLAKRASSATSAPWPHAAAVSSASSYAESGYTQRTGTAAGCPAATGQSGFTPNQYLTAYNYAPLQAAGLRGQGERVALIEIDGFRYSDLRHFADCFGLATPAINGYGVGLRHPLPPGGESTLDLEVLDAAAPQLKAVDVYESRPSAVDVLHSLTAPLANRSSKPDVISASLGSCEPETLATIGSSGLRSVEGALALAAASGISVLAASGDDGSSACLTPSGRPLPGLAVSYPASSPWVTGVGGTNVSLNSANQIIGQQVWNDAPLVVAAAGGGSSVEFRRPAYQNGVVVPNHRWMPDVSMLADIAPGYEIYCTAKGDCVSGQHPGAWTQVGGTSAASPLLAGGLALVDQNLRLHGQQALGLANPLLYGIFHSPSASSVLSDVVTNENDLGESITGRPFGCCTAETGYDQASGLGSINLQGLANAAALLVPKLVSVRLSLPSQRHPVASRRLVARVSCSGRCLLGAYAHIQIGRSRRLITRASTEYLLRRAGRRMVTISLNAPVLSQLRAALGRRQRVTAVLYGTIVDPNGTIIARTAGARLRISR